MNGELGWCSKNCEVTIYILGLEGPDPKDFLANCSVHLSAVISSGDSRLEVPKPGFLHVIKSRKGQCNYGE